jgi:hypothetical protein
MRCAVRIAGIMDKKDAYSVLVPEWKKPVGKSRRWLGNNIKMYLRETPVR